MSALTHLRQNWSREAEFLEEQKAHAKQIITTIIRTHPMRRILKVTAFAAAWVAVINTQSPVQ
ncbi:MAG: hypothetical protein ABJ034_15500, partial [Hyphomicrobiales bacterium]